jgi:hypothetical protein
MSGKPWLAPQNPTFYQTIVRSPQWQAWVKKNEKDPQFDVHESVETGWLSEKHWQAFLEWVRNGDTDFSWSEASDTLLPKK